MRISEVKEVKGSHRRPEIVLGLPTLGSYPAKVFIAYTRLQLPVNCISNTILVENMEIGEARNYIVKDIMEMDIKNRPKYLLFLGDDMLPPWDGLIKLYDEMIKGKWDVLSALYYMKSEPPTVVGWRLDISGPLIVNKHFKSGEVIFVDVCGMDFTLINTDIFEDINEPYFKTGPDVNIYEDGEGINKYTEDTYFLNKCKEKGYKIGIHTGIRVGHLYTKTGEIY